MKVKDRIEGALVGLLVGDAVGTPYEFNEKFKGGGIPPLDQIDMVPPEGYDRSHEQVPPGTWSDDGSQTLCLLESYLNCKGLDLRDFGDKLIAWLLEGHNAPDNYMFGSGGVTRQSLQRLISGFSPEEAGLADDEHNGNGALMRVLPVSLWYTLDMMEGTSAMICTMDMLHDAMQQSRVTHGHLKSQLCCAIYCNWINDILIQDECLDFESSRHFIEEFVDNDPRGQKLDIAHTLMLLDEIEDFDNPQGSGYVVDTLHSARKAYQESISFEDTIKAAIAMGNDSDTTAAVAGGLAGAAYGIEGIPKRWLDQLRGREILDPLLKTLLGD